MFLHIISTFLFFSTSFLNPHRTPQYSEQNSGSIRVSISNIRTNNGKVNVSLFAQSDGFPSNSEKAVAVQTVDIQQNKANIRFDKLPFGTYAIACLHDENMNGKMDKNGLGIPKEGYGASNNAVSKFAAPKFSEAKFPFNSAVLSVNFKMHYW